MNVHVSYDTSPVQLIGLAPLHIELQATVLKEIENRKYEQNYS